MVRQEFAERTASWLWFSRKCSPRLQAVDFPREFSMDNCMEELDEIREREDLSDDHKAAILGENARRFYRH